MNDELQSTERPMMAADIDRVIELDALSGEQRRSDFFHKRWQRIQHQPEVYISIVSEKQGSVNGFLSAHVLEGEFGSNQRIAVLDALAVAPGDQGSGTGTVLVDAFKREAHTRKCVEILTQVVWEQQDLLAFFSHCGFTLAPVSVLEKQNPDH